MASPASKTLLHLLMLLCILLQGAAGGGQQGKKRREYLREASSFREELGKEKFDYIVVGGGTAGCPLAATLSLHYKVLVLERGGSPYGNRNVSYMENFHISLADVSPSSASQPFVSTDGVINSRARVLGGGTCINAGFYSRASPRFVEEAGWDWEVVNASYRWVEDRIVFRPKIAPWQAALRDGLLDSGVAPFNGYTYDHLYGTKVGGTIFDDTGFRHTAADLLESGNAANLVVLLHATATRILFRRRHHRLRAVGVEFKDNRGELHRVTAGAEIVVSAGAMGSPQLLLLSGVGPKADLEKLGIPVLLENGHVGKEMSDNPMNSIFIPTKHPVQQSLIQTVGITKQGTFIEASSGFGQSGDSIHCHHGIMSAEIGQLATVPPAKRSLALAREFAAGKKDVPVEAFRGGFILEKIDGPLSKGELALETADVDCSPRVTFNYFRHPADLRRCVAGVRAIERLVRTRRYARASGAAAASLATKRLLEASVKANVNLIPKHTNDTASLEQFCRDTVITIWHYHGGCRVGKVVDRQLRLLDAAGLRVVDGSTFRTSPGTNPQATVLMLGRYMGVKMLRERLGRAAAGV